MPIDESLENALRKKYIFLETSDRIEFPLGWVFLMWCFCEQIETLRKNYLYAHEQRSVYMRVKEIFTKNGTLRIIWDPVEVLNVKLQYFLDLLSAELQTKVDEITKQTCQCSLKVCADCGSNGACLDIDEMGGFIVYCKKCSIKHSVYK